MTTYIVTVCLHMIVNGCIHKMIKPQEKPWPLPDTTPLSCMQKIEVTGASNLALLFFTPRVFLYSISIFFVGCFCYTMLL